METARVLKSRDVCELRRHAITKLWADIKRGILTPPVKRGPRDNIWPATEIDQIVRAEIRGASVAERQELCKQLIAKRKQA